MVVLCGMKRWWILLILFVAVIAYAATIPYAIHIPRNDQPTISFTFDDGKTNELGGVPMQTWHHRILNTLSKHKIKAIMFVAGHNKRTVNGKYVLSTWNNEGHFLANHTLNHPNFNEESTTLEQYKHELLSNDALIKQYSNYIKLFRFPYLKEGNTKEKVNGFRSFLQQQGYRHGHVTIDCADWYIDSRLRNRLLENPQADISGFKKYYIEHIYDRAMYYDSIALVLTGRHINHSLLLHHNLAAAFFLDELIAHFKAKGWKVIDAHKAYEDKVYQTITQTNPAGESLTWSMAKESGKFEGQLRYPAEGDQYEKDKMDALGL